ncbi:MAG: hypothetical protein RI973_592 [Bacteroidota bacterium]|jgi:nicotinamidase/pyrazinamidase
MKNALLVIGMQVDLLPGGPAEVPGSDELIACINEQVAKHDLLIAANFHQPANHCTFAANHPWRRPGQTIDIGGRPTLLTHLFGVQGSFGAEWMPGLSTQGIAFTALMGAEADIPPYSAFYDADKQRDTSLNDFLAANQVDALCLAGIPLDEVVRNTALDSLALGYRTSLLVPCCRARLPEQAREVLRELELAGALLVNY